MPNSTFNRIKRSARELNQSFRKPSAPGLRVFNAESIQKLDALAWEVMTTTGTGTISIKLVGGPGQSHWRFDLVTLQVDSESFRQTLT